MNQQEKYELYWRRNIRLVVALLIVWAIPSFLLSIVFVDQLNRIQIAGFPLGFWFAQQGSIYIFVLLILFYVLRMDKLDKEFRDSEDEEEQE